jgi:hypothetical protein
MTRRLRAATPLASRPLWVGYATFASTNGGISANPGFDSPRSAPPASEARATVAAGQQDVYLLVGPPYANVYVATQTTGL